MNPKKIVLIDDQKYGIDQIYNAIPAGKHKDYQVEYFHSYTLFSEKEESPIYIALLDYYLEPGELNGAEIAARINAEIIIGFSSVMRASEKIADTALNNRHNGKAVSRAFAIQKLRYTVTNEPLVDLFTELL